uniref:DNA-directed RNA polymerase I subunit D n=2 Tax=Parascaris TaxID=6254 RepID=A0A915C1V9_PARUN
FLQFPVAQMSASVSVDLVDKVEILNPEALQKDPTNLTVILHEEDHTIGNSLKHILCKMAEVEFCGYNVPHPLEDKILVRVQTRRGVSAASVLIEALDQLELVFASIRQKFQSALEEFHS